MKPIISHKDYQTLRNLVNGYPEHLKTKEIGQLMEELDRAEKVDESALDIDIIKINSVFEAEDINTGKILKLTLTLPHQANLKEQKISVLSPLGVALIGFRKGMTVEWQLPGGMKTLKILDVINN